MKQESVTTRRPPKRDLNRISIEGKVVTRPKFSQLPSGTKSVVFRIASNETFESRGKKNWHTNEVTIEALGRLVGKVKDTLKKGNSYIFDGYLRSDKDIAPNGRARRRVRIRIYHFEES